MPSLNFQERFADDVEAGRKPCSIRATLRFKVGDTVHLFTGMRTKKCRRLGRGTVTKIEPVRIESWKQADRPNKLMLRRGAVWLVESGLEQLARMDGFASWEAMGAWFNDTHGLPFSGWMISWKLESPAALAVDDELLRLGKKDAESAPLGSGLVLEVSEGATHELGLAEGKAVDAHGGIGGGLGAQKGLTGDGAGDATLDEEALGLAPGAKLVGVHMNTTRQGEQGGQAR